jgi:hypothetical protein
VPSARTTGTVTVRISARLVVVPLATAALLTVEYLLWTPRSPDLFAQLARAGVAQRVGAVGWWTGWFGGLALPSYSVITPPVMAIIGVTTAGVVAVLLNVVAGTLLVRGAPRPTAAALGLAVTATADLAVGRVTFAVGAAMASWSLVAVRERWWPWAAPLAIATYLASPLAGLFLGLLLVAVAVSDRTRRMPLAALAAALIAAGCIMQLWFPGAGTMPITVSDVLPAAGACVAIAATRPPRTLQTAALVTTAATLVVLAFPGAVGSNITRLVWMCSVPALLGYARLPSPKLAAVTALAAAWPITDTVQQLSTSTDRTTQAGFYRPLADAIRTQQTIAGPAAIGERVEAVDTASHGASAYLPPAIALARGWDRQADRRYNPLFYTGKPVDAAAYRAWLTHLAVGWVAVPHGVTLDYAGSAENRLVSAGLPYLPRVWRNRTWTLYHVTGASPLAVGASVDSVADTTVTLTARRATSVTVQIRWSPYLVVRDTATGPRDRNVCVRDASGFVRAYLPQAGTYTITSRFDAKARWDTDGCLNDPPAPLR